MKLELWEILVPVEFDLYFHQQWDEKVSKIIGGVTLLQPLKGRWLAGEEIVRESMIPVRLVGTREQIEQVVDLTLQHYNQASVLAYKISDDVILKNRW